jgi:hypothetical protein
MEQIDTDGELQFASHLLLFSQSHATGLGIYICANTPHISACVKVQASIPSTLSVADALLLLVATYMLGQLQINSRTLLFVWCSIAVSQAINATDSCMPLNGNSVQIPSHI